MGLSAAKTTHFLLTTNVNGLTKYKDFESKTSINRREVDCIRIEWTRTCPTRLFSLYFSCYDHIFCTEPNDNVQTMHEALSITSFFPN